MHPFVVDIHSNLCAFERKVTQDHLMSTANTQQPILLSHMKWRQRHLTHQTALWRYPSSLKHVCAPAFSFFPCVIIPSDFEYLLFSHHNTALDLPDLGLKKRRPSSVIIVTYPNYHRQYGEELQTMHKYGQTKDAGDDR